MRLLHSWDRECGSLIVFEPCDEERMSKNSKLLVTVGEAAELLSLGRSLTYQLVMRGQIPSLKVGRARRVPVSALELFISERLAAEAGDQPTEALGAR